MNASKTDIRITSPDREVLSYSGVPKEHPFVKESPELFWYAVRVTYSRELALKEYLDGECIENFIPMHYEYIVKNERRVRKLVPAVHNLVFIRSSRERIDRIKDEMGMPLSAKVEGYLLDESNPHAMYDLLGWVKSDLIGRFYVNATDELPDVREALDLCNEIGAISAYAYLGDVGSSVTGDKRAQKFEDDYLDELIPYIKELGFRAVTYMPSRNTRAQLERLRALCEKYELFQISGEDINSPRQSFVCEAQRDPAFRNLVESTWALIAHEWRSTVDPQNGLFSPESVKAWPDFNERVRVFALEGRKL